MGITRESLVHYRTLKENGHIDFTQKLNVIELGAQTVHFDDKPFFKDVLTSLNLNPELSEKYNYDMTCRFMHESWGHNYDCIDLDPLDPKALQWNLNTVECPTDYIGKFDIVTNHGTTEHLLGQVNSFKLMHDLMKVGGISVHVLPCIEPNHGFFSYSPVLFQCIAEQNNYEIIGFYLSRLMNSGGIQELIPYTGSVTFAPCYVHCILKKKEDSEFKIASQIFNKGVK
jgi:DNA polymerase III psi subunit